MSEDLLALELGFLVARLRSRAKEGEPISPQETTQIAAALAGFIPRIAALENPPVPGRLRLIRGGRDVLPIRLRIGDPDDPDTSGAA